MVAGQRQRGGAPVAGAVGDGDGEAGAGQGADKHAFNQAKKAADAISAYIMSEGLWHLTRALPENHAKHTEGLRKYGSVGMCECYDVPDEAYYDGRVAAEAIRIKLAHLFDPMMAVHTSNVDPLPHQITAVYESMLPRQPLRYVLAPLHHLSTNHVSSYTAYLDAARLLQGQRRPGTPAQRRLSMSTRKAAYVSVCESGLTPSSSR